MMTDYLDFSSNEAGLSEFIVKSAFMLLVWILLLSLTRRACTIIASVFWSHPIPFGAVYIPSNIPHPNPPGSAVPFDLPLLEASEKEIETFMLFVQNKNIACSLSTKINNKWALQDVAHCAAAYKGQLYEERTMKWIDDHFRLKLPNLKYPYVDRHWNGWSSFWLETGTHIQSMFLSSAIVVVEHTINGLILPICYLMTKNVIYYHLALYGEVAYMVYASLLIFVSRYLGRDITIEQMHPAVWSLLLLHHISSLILCVSCLLIGNNVPRNLVCYVLLALLGLTSSLHYFGQILDFSPYAQANAPNTRLFHHILCLVSQILFRVIYWVKICYLSVHHCVESHGVGIATVLLLILTLFTVFNFDFVRFHLKATKGCWIRIQQTKNA